MDGMTRRSIVDALQLNTRLNERETGLSPDIIPCETDNLLCKGEISLRKLVPQLWAEY
jgi:hypothetical protein